MPSFIPYPIYTFYLVCCCAYTICVPGKAFYQHFVCWAWWRTGGWRTVKSGGLVSVEELCPRGSIYTSKSLWATPDSFLGSVTFLSSKSDEVLGHLLIFADDTLLGGKSQILDDLIMSQKDVDSLWDRLPRTELCPSVLGVTAVLTAPPWQRKEKPPPPHPWWCEPGDEERVESQDFELMPSSVKARHVV